jgi:serine/threonine-protein phosphatase CPPED1
VLCKGSVKKRAIAIGMAALCILLFIAFKVWDLYAPLPVTGWNRAQISRIEASRADTFSFAVFGDNKDGYYLFDVLLKDIDHRRDLSFALDIGDLVPRGTRGHFRRYMGEVRADLSIPLLAAIGNHDLNAGSSDNYRKIFGETYYSFSIGENYFIILDATKESGFDKQEYSWLEEELKKAQRSTNRFVFMHVPPFDPRGKGLNKCLQDGKELMDLFSRYQVTHLFASHIHGYFSGVWEGIPYTITGGAGGSLQGQDPDHFFHHFVTVHVGKTGVETRVDRIDADYAIASLFGTFEDYALEWGLLLPPAIVLFGFLVSLRRRKRPGV